MQESFPSEQEKDFRARKENVRLQGNYYYYCALDRSLFSKAGKLPVLSFCSCK